MASIVISRHNSTLRSAPTRSGPHLIGFLAWSAPRFWENPRNPKGRRGLRHAALGSFAEGLRPVLGPSVVGEEGGEQALAVGREGVAVGAVRDEACLAQFGE